MPGKFYGRAMKISVQASTGIEVIVWRDGTWFHATRAGSDSEPQLCMPIDLFEVIAELADLDLERVEDAREALGLADEAQRDLAST
jgi:hypothetical protein